MLVERNGAALWITLNRPAALNSANADMLRTGDSSGGDTLTAANRAILAIREIAKPVVAAVNGLAAGVGVSLAAACDVGVAAEGAYFLLALTNIGLMPDGGATVLLPAAVGRARALRMALLTERIGATEAAEWGLVSHVSKAETFQTDVDGLIDRLSAGPPLAYAETKRAINSATIDDIAGAMDRETAGQKRLVRSHDFREGVAALREKRPPSFLGR
ncbi:hypothetical protein AU186_03740 [Mycobacterium sp. GA-1999]|nr:hypothetical protein AU186_03740 [Mycobacterium sp. GA-1999]